MMGYVQIIKSDKTGFHIEDDEIKKIQVEFCDRCNKWKLAADGANQVADQIVIAWFCEECK